MTRPQVLIVGFVLAASACGSPAAGPNDRRVAPVYNRETGKLEQLVSDRDGDGRPETRAFMDGAVLKHIEIDRNGDGKPDRWEYYTGGPFAGAGAGLGAPAVERAEEANGPDARITRREFFSGGVVQRVEDDTDANGRTDKWEWYEKGQLARVELDLVGKGFPSQRLVYGDGGSVIRIETDPDGDGVFVAVPMRGSNN
jgi:hypothetical protein